MIERALSADVLRMLIELFEELKESVSKKAKKDDFFDAEQMD